MLFSNPYRTYQKRLISESLHDEKGNVNITGNYLKSPIEFFFANKNEEIKVIKSMMIMISGKSGIDTSCYTHSESLENGYFIQWTNNKKILSFNDLPIRTISDFFNLIPPKCIQKKDWGVGDKIVSIFINFELLCGVPIILMKKDKIFIKFKDDLNSANKHIIRVYGYSM